MWPTYISPLRGGLLVGILFLCAVAAVRAQVDVMPADDAAIVAKLLPEARLLPGGVRFVVRQEGSGDLIKRGDRVTALYVGRLLDGTVFNQKRSRFHSFHFEVGAKPRQTIQGWELALPLMREGGTYAIAIPSLLAYHDRGRAGQVPPHATLHFEIEILKVERAAVPTPPSPAATAAPREASSKSAAVGVRVGA